MDVEIKDDILEEVVVSHVERSKQLSVNTKKLVTISEGDNFGGPLSYSNRLVRISKGKLAVINGIMYAVYVDISVSLKPLVSNATNQHTCVFHICEIKTKKWTVVASVDIHMYCDYPAGALGYLKAGYFTLVGPYIVVANNNRRDKQGLMASFTIIDLRTSESKQIVRSMYDEARSKTPLPATLRCVGLAYNIIFVGEDHKSILYRLPIDDDDGRYPILEYGIYGVHSCYYQCDNNRLYSYKMNHNPPLLSLLCINTMIPVKTIGLAQIDVPTVMLGRQFIKIQSSLSGLVLVAHYFDGASRRGLCWEFAYLCLVNWNLSQIHQTICLHEKISNGRELLCPLYSSKQVWIVGTQTNYLVRPLVPVHRHFWLRDVYFEQDPVRALREADMEVDIWNNADRPDEHNYSFVFVAVSNKRLCVFDGPIVDDREDEVVEVSDIGSAKEGLVISESRDDDDDRISDMPVVVSVFISVGSSLTLSR